MKTYRKIALQVESLEGRELLSTLAANPIRVAPADVIEFGYVSHGSTRESTVQNLMITMGYGPPKPPPPEPWHLSAGAFGPSVISRGR